MENIIFRLRTDEVRKIRQQKGLSQENVANEIGLSQSQYSRIEQGDCAVPYEKVTEISNVLKVSLMRLLKQEVTKNLITAINRATIIPQ